MTAGKLQDQLAYPPRALRADRAAAYLSMSVSTFHKLVADKMLPPAVHVGGMALWDRLELDSAFENWKAQGEDHEPPRNSWAAIREQEERER